MRPDAGPNALPIDLDREDVLADVPALPVLALAGLASRVHAVADAPHALEALAGRLDEVGPIAAWVDGAGGDRWLR